MSWLSQADVEIKLGDVPNPNLLVNCWAASEFLDEAFYQDSFELLDEWETCIVLTSEGLNVASELAREGVLNGERLIAFNMFRVFFWHGLLIDHEATNFARVLAYLNNLQTVSDVRWPYVFGHALYNKFNDTYDGNRTEFMDAEHVQELLKGTPQGVFQLGTILSGPLGFLESSERRAASPTLQLPLWHCSDPGCQSLHLVNARQFDSHPLITYKKMRRFLHDAYGPRSEWNSPLRRFARGSDWPSGRPYADMPGILGDCVIGAERGALLQRALCSTSAPLLRDCIATKKGLRGQATEIVKELTQEEQHQLLLMIPDRDLVTFLDELVAERKIDIPPSEVRTGRTYSGRLSKDRSTAISLLGTKSVKHPPMIHLYAQIWNTYQKLGMIEDLTW